MCLQKANVCFLRKWASEDCNATLGHLEMSGNRLDGHHSCRHALLKTRLYSLQGILVEVTPHLFFLSYATIIIKCFERRYEWLKTFRLFRNRHVSLLLHAALKRKEVVICQMFSLLSMVRLSVGVSVSCA